jgi:hypothetical protein
MLELGWRSGRPRDSHPDLSKLRHHIAIFIRADHGSDLRLGAGALSRKCLKLKNSSEV